MRYAEVAVDFPEGHSTFCYAIPSNLNIEPGQAVRVPFGYRNLPGIVVELGKQPSVGKVKEIASIINASPVLSSLQIELAQWISQRYLAPLFDSLALMLPPGFEGKKGVKPKLLTYINLEIGKDEIATEITSLNKSRAHKQAQILKFLNEQNCPILVTEARRHVNCSAESIKALVQRHLISLENINVRRDPLSHFEFQSEFPPNLTSSQEAAWKTIEDKLKDGSNGSPLVFLLAGVTGSGKTELYLRALAMVVSQGKRGICLVPEIALTPQTVERFASRFPERVAVLHSGLSMGEQSDEWHWIAEANCDVVIGPRSALFSPQSDLGLIIIDEEHEWTYKQEDKSPRYHARDVAIKLAEISGATVILGSATPDIESFHQAQSGKYQLIELKERITPRGYSPLPEVSIVDMKEELKMGNTSLFSRSLSRAIEETLERDEQIILFLNRRGSATFVQCRHCRFVLRCPRCSVAFTYHSAERKLICHRCS
ncbi:MAG: primosomal protein N', partial [Chloroflexota bacterium]|nr:primosomal protein N' [Chloroflexota bacterium]